MVRQWLDDPNAVRWSDANLDMVIQLVIDDLWTDLLDMNPQLTSQLHTFTTVNTPGYIDLRQTTHGGDLTQRFYRVHEGGVVRGSRQYVPREPSDTVIEEDTGIVYESYTYYVQGDFLWLFPLSTSDQVELRYSYKPTQYTSLTDGMVVPFPEGHELAYVLTAAALAMPKGAAEDPSTLQMMADKAVHKLLAAVRRQTHGAAMFSGGFR